MESVESIDRLDITMRVFCLNYFIILFFKKTLFLLIVVAIIISILVPDNPFHCTSHS